MNLSNYYYSFIGGLSPRICDDIIAYGKQQSEEMGITGNENITPTKEKDISKLHKRRNSNVVWMSDWWIYKEIQPFINKANKDAGWNFDWDFSEPCQFTIYRETQHYDWHMDVANKPYNRPMEPQYNGKIRKLSVTISLCDGSEYEGGDLEFDLRNREDSKSVILKSKEARQKGSVIVFPSFVWHRVAPVTKGTRYSLVLWNLGYPYR